jgi:hypothetical protein
MQLESSLLLATKSTLSWMSSPDSLPVYKRDEIRVSPALDWARVDWAELDGKQLVLVAVGFGKADMYGEVL